MNSDLSFFSNKERAIKNMVPAYFLFTKFLQRKETVSKCNKFSIKRNSPFPYECTYFLRALNNVINTVTQETEKLRANVKVGAKTLKTLKCSFTMAWEGKVVVIKKSRVSCKPRLKAKVTDFQLEGSAGVFTLDFSTKPNRITAGSLGNLQTIFSLSAQNL